MIVNSQNTTTLYDIGVGPIVLLGIGLPIGSAFDYIWNLIVFSIALLFISGNNRIKISISKRLLYCLFITFLGIIIDLGYLALTWDMSSIAYSFSWSTEMPQALQFVWLLLPIVLLFLANFALSYVYLKLSKQQAIKMGIIMGIFTAPWLLPILPYVFGWIN